MSRTIIVSDLHIDTWDGREIGRTGKKKHEHFLEFLDRCERAGIREIVINGDVMDLPPYGEQFAFPVGQCIKRDVIERLVAFSSKIPVTCVFGNHDIGISGFRCMGENSIAPLRNINFCYPNYKIDDYAESTILVEHGHFHDPAIALYMRDLRHFTYKVSEFEAYNWTMQRRNPRDPSKRVGLGAIEPVRVAPGENAFAAIKRSKSGSASLWARLKQTIWRWGDLATAGMRKDIWRNAAVDELREYLRENSGGDHTTKPAIYQIYGHTHRSDIKGPVKLGRGVSGYYVNSGSWCGDLDEGWYLDVDDNGKVWIQDWINEPDDLKRL